MFNIIIIFIITAVAVEILRELPRQGNGMEVSAETPSAGTLGAGRDQMGLRRVDGDKPHLGGGGHPCRLRRLQPGVHEG